MAWDCKVLADSIASGVRLTTWLATGPRIILAEVNTHRQFCLAGDAVLEFDLPAGSTNSKHRVHRMRLDEFVDKWLHGARRFAANPKREYDLSWIEDQYATVTATVAAARMGMSSAANINALCRRGVIRAEKNKHGEWVFTGHELKRWRQSTPEHTRFDMRAKLAGMRIRQLNEETGDIQWSNVVDACESGSKEVFEVVAGDFTVAGSADHLVLRGDGGTTAHDRWVRIGDLKKGDLIVVQKRGKHDDEKSDPMRLKKINGAWRSQWQRNRRAKMIAASPLCRRCGACNGTEIHHIEPVYLNPARAFDVKNITLLCDGCHDEMHETQGWQGGTYLYGAVAVVEEIVSRGVEKTYDLEIAGEFPNFLANGVVVHNSRNSASSRAIPVEKRIQQILDDPFIPEAFGANKKGMQAGEMLGTDDNQRARYIWLTARDHAIDRAMALATLGVHKQWANRLIEPFAWQPMIISATETENFFNLRISPEAQPEIRKFAEMMKETMDASTPVERKPGDWHLPLVERWNGPGEFPPFASEHDARLPIDTLVKLSVARCARVSYLTHEGKRDVDADLALYDRLLKSGHMSPFEHAAKVACQEEIEHHALWRRVPAMERDGCYDRSQDSWQAVSIGNFRAPWVSHRKMIPGEAVFKPRT